ncbi:MAG: glutamate-5-semialdehyde dehydrogenase [Nitrosomonadales bacterium]
MQNKYLKELLTNAKNSSKNLATISTRAKNNFLNFLAENLKKNQNIIIKENKKDIQSAKKNKLDAAFIDRLSMNVKTIDSMIQGIKNIIALDDPIGKIRDISTRPNGLKIGKMRVPLGVILMIYESRPNVTIDAAALAIKSNNSIILRGGSESINSNLALEKILKKSLSQSKINSDSIQIVKDTSRDIVTNLIKQNEFIDVIIPRGGKGLIKNIAENARIPVIKHLDGNCHIYIDKDADINMALSITVNSKTQRFGTCNTLESLVVHKEIAKKLLPQLQKKLDQHKVEIRGCSETLKILKNITKANADDFYEEYLAPILSVKVISDTNLAIEFINKHSSGHTEAIISNNHQNCMEFLNRIDSSSVMINASTRFADGFEYGLGAEIGISTDKFHARGPVGLEGLTSEKYIVFGQGQIRS